MSFGNFHYLPCYVIWLARAKESIDQCLVEICFPLSAKQQWFLELHSGIIWKVIFFLKLFILISFKGMTYSRKEAQRDTKKLPFSCTDFRKLSLPLLRIMSYLFYILIKVTHFQGVIKYIRQTILYIQPILPVNE